MRCATCGADNPEGLKFCEECGTKLVRACPHCGQQVRPTAKFCGECGGSLAAPPQTGRKQRQPTAQRGKRSKARAPEAMEPRPAVPAAERRQLTVQFIDLV